MMPTFPVGGKRVFQRNFALPSLRGLADRYASDMSARPSTAEPPPTRGTLAVLARGPFRRYAVGTAISQTGTWMQSMAQSWVMTGLTNSALMLGVVQAAISLPMLALSMYGGTLADRHDKRRILIITQFVQITLAIVVGWLVMTLVTARPQVVPGRLQMAGEMAFGMVDDLASQLIGPEGRRYFPFVFTLFTFILAMNLLGLFLIFTATSQLAVTATLAVMTILLVLGVGFARNGIGFFKLFMPSGVPIYVLPLVIPIEFVSFLLRPFTLALRLFGNMLGGARGAQGVRRLYHQPDRRGGGRRVRSGDRRAGRDPVAGRRAGA